MKKPRHFLLVFMSLIMAFVLVFAVACDGCSCNSTPSDPVLSSIELDDSKVKTEYLVGDDYSSTGLEIKAHFDNGDTQTVSRVAEGVTLDSSAFDKYNVGKYEIKITYTLNEVSKEASYFVYVNTVSISLDASAAKTQFIVNDEDFSTSGLKVYRTLTTFEGDKKEELAAGAYTVLQGGFDKTKTGTYTITIQYDYLLHSFKDEYEVKVTDARQGIEVAFKEDKAENETIVLAGTTDAVATADLSEFASWITARKADKYGNVPADAAALDLTAEGTTVKLYEGETEITDASALSSGVYTIMVETADKDAAGNDCTLCGFVNVWVVDNLKSLTFKDTAENTKTTQLAGKDIISKTWQFVATYESGRVETVTTSNKNIAIENLRTTEATEEAGSVATVSFTSVNSQLKETVKTAEVTYIVNPLTGIQNYELTYKVENKAWTSEWKDDFEGASSQLSITPTAQASVKENDWSEVKNSADKYVTVVVGNDAKNVTISAIMKTSNKSRHFYITTDLTAVEANKIAEVTPEATNTEYELKAENVAAGTYYITSLTKDDTIKIHSVTVTYSVNYDGGDVEEQVKNVIVTAGDLTAGDITDSNTTLTNGGVTFTLHASSSNKFTVDASAKTVTLPQGVTNSEGQSSLSVANRLKTNGKSSSTDRLITFSTDRSFTIYIYALSGSSSDTGRKLTFAANKEVTTSDVTGIKTFDEGVDTSSNPTARAKKVSGVSAETEFTIGFSAAINVYAICIVFD